MRAAEILARWRAGREAAPALPEALPTGGDRALFPPVPGSAGEPGTAGNADKSGLFPLFPAVPGANDQGCNVERRERADVAESEPEADAGPGNAPEGDDAPPFRLPSWGDPADAPRPGDRCGCCGRHGSGGRWWIERAEPKGWRCARCHPADHLPDGAVIEVRT
jgi:hypothetical protein